MTTRTMKTLDTRCLWFWGINPKSGPRSEQKAGELAPSALQWNFTRKNRRQEAAIDAHQESVPFLENTSRNKIAGDFKVEQLLVRERGAFGLWGFSSNFDYKESVNPLEEKSPDTAFRGRCTGFGDHSHDLYTKSK